MASIFNHLNAVEEAIKKGRFGLITDVDGTISPTTPMPGEAVVSRLCLRYLSLLKPSLALVALVSGRSMADLRRMVSIDGLVYIGNHGLEWWAGDKTELAEGAAGFPEQLKKVIKGLGTLLDREGIFLENKGVTAAIHYRHSPEPKAAEKGLLEALEGSKQAGKLRIMRGKMCLNLLPALKINKGTATRDLIKRFRLEGAIYMGDDVTDLDAFRAIREAGYRSAFRGFAIAVTSREAPPGLTAAADFTLDGVKDVERFLQWLAERAAQPG